MKAADGRSVDIVRILRSISTPEPAHPWVYGSYGAVDLEEMCDQAARQILELRKRLKKGKSK